MTSPVLMALLLLASFGTVACATDSAADSPAEQQRIARSLGEKVQRFEMWTDDDGNVTGLIFINHQSLTKSIGEKPGITNDDLLQLQRFPKLTALNVESQPIGDQGLAVLKHCPQMKQVGFHYMAKAPGANASPDFVTVIRDMRDLEIIEIKHNFRMKAINVDQLPHPFPKVWRLVLDTPLSADQTMHMLRLCPNVTDLQLHRTALSAEQLVEAARLLPKLEVFLFKPKGDLQAEHLAALQHFPKLRIYSPQQYKNQLPYENGWDQLLKVPTLQRLEIAGSREGTNGSAMESLKQARPQLEIDDTLTRSRNYNGL